MDIWQVAFECIHHYPIILKQSCVLGCVGEAVFNIIILAIVTIFIIIPLLVVLVIIIISIFIIVSHHIDASDPLVFGGIGETVLKGLEGHWKTQSTQLAVKQ